MQEHRIGERFFYLRYGADAGWRDVYAHPHPHAQRLHRLAEGAVVLVLGSRRQGPVLWFQVRVTLIESPRTTPRCRVSFIGYLKAPAHQPESVLAPVPELRYATGEVQGGVPSVLAQGDVVILVDGYRGRGEGVYNMVPLSETAAPDQGWIEPCDLAQIDAGPFRTANNVLYWHVQDLNGAAAGWVREAARAGSRYEAKIRPYRLAQNR
ncbi:MAG TPA: hypothetical protein VNK95_13220 [Caldilineaceae bacterium]|nr:hypothetical protein [Caldilineaceae bacterium]